MFYFVSIVAILLSFSNVAAEAEDLFVRVNEETLTLETAFRSYMLSPIEHDKAPIEVTLIGLDHEGVDEYYKTIDNMLKDHIVLYELNGAKLEELQEKEAYWKGLPEPYWTFYQRMINRVGNRDSLDRISQSDGLTYSQCAELVHADSILPPPGQEQEVPQTWKIDFDMDNPSEMDREWVLKYGTLEHMQKFLEARGRFLLNRQGVTFDRNDLFLKIEEVLEKGLKEFAAFPTKEQHSDALRMQISKLAKETHAIRTGTHTYNEFEEFISIGRNEYIFSALENVLNRRPLPSNKIAVVYGAFHLPFVENFLQEKGFKLSDEKSGWLVVAHLTPKKSDQEEEPSSDVPQNALGSDEEVTVEEELPTIGMFATLKSSDDITLIYLIGSSSVHEWDAPDMPSDNVFLNNVKENQYLKKLQNAAGENSEIFVLPKKVTVLFTPRNLPMLVENLVNEGYRLHGMLYIEPPQAPMIVIAEKIIF